MPFLDWLRYSLYLFCCSINLRAFYHKFRSLTGFSFEAGGRTFRPVVCHSTSGPLRSILAIFFTTVLYIFLTKASFSNLLFKENFSERQHCLGNCFLGSRNAGNGVSEYSLLKLSWGSMPPDPPRCLRLRRSRGALRRQENFHVRFFQKYVRYFTKQLKSLYNNV